MQSRPFKVLMVDGDQDRRKERISVLKQRGFTVYPALQIQQARERCKPGTYDLIVVNAGNDWDLALDLCDEIKRKDPNQLLLLMAAENASLPRREFTISDRPELLLERVQTALAGAGSAVTPLAA